MTHRNKLVQGKNKGQSYVELALVIPVVLLLLAGLVEIGFLFFTYLNLLDLTREAARFASVRDFKIASPGPASLAECRSDTLDYFKDTACFFIDPDLNPYLPITNTHYADVAISVFTVSGNQVTDRWPKPPIDDNNDGVWSLYNDNWKKDCQGNTVATAPYFTNSEVESRFISTAPDDRGLVLVEAYLCYDQLLNFPVISAFIAKPFRLHAYTVMPAPEAIPTPTPIGP